MLQFASLLERLIQDNVDFILVGGLAVDLSGFSRATNDVDILIRYERVNIEKLLRSLESFGEGHARELRIEDFDLEEGCIRIYEEFPLDVFTIMGGYCYEDLEPFTCPFSIYEGCSLKFLGPEGLIKLKSDSVRPKDQIDVEVLKKLISND